MTASGGGAEMEVEGADVAMGAHTCLHNTRIQKHEAHTMSKCTNDDAAQVEPP
jgi:hypothetical protein